MVTGNGTKDRECTVDGCEGKETGTYAINTVYLVPNSNWKVDGARFAIYYFENGNPDGWLSMTDSDGDGIYECDLSSIIGTYTNIIFCRMNPSGTTNSWDTKWNQSSDLKVPTDLNVRYTVAEGAWDKGAGTWSTAPHSEHVYNAANCTTPMTCVLCGTTTGVANGHDYTSVVTAPTCEDAGYTTYTCHCGDTYTDDVVDALGHIHTAYTSNGNATCTQDGTKTSVCDVCGEDAITITDVGSALPHTEVVDAAVAATCTTDGKTEGKHCSACEKVLVKQEVVKASGHAWDDGVVTVQPDCENTGIITINCENCDATKTEVAPALGHIDENGDHHCDRCPANLCTDHAWVDANCTTPKTCSKCHATEGDSLGHKAGEAVKEHITNATCTEAGSYESVVYCSRCDVELTRTNAVIDALGHDEVSHNAQAPTCTEIGWNAYVTCSRCDYTTYEALDVVDHTYTEFISNNDATCTQDGTVTATCDVCKESSVNMTDVGSSLGHNEVPHDAKAPTCTEVGNEAYVTCTRCDYTTYKEISANGHTYGVWMATEDGMKVHYCVVDGCEGSETKAIDHGTVVYLTPNGNWNEAGARFAIYYFETEKQDGWLSMTDSDGDGIYECDLASIIGTYTNIIFCRMDPASTTNSWDTKWNQSSDLKVPTTQYNHYVVAEDAWDKGEGEWIVSAHECVYNAATCTAPMTCVLCGHTEGEALGHKYESIVTAPTCETAGYTTYTCSVCDHSYTSDAKDALGHEYDDDADTTCNNCDHVRVLCQHTNTTTIPGKAATCQSTGISDGVVCNDCGETIVAQKDTPVVGHTYNKKVEMGKYLTNAKSRTYKYSCECGAAGSTTFTGTTLTVYLKPNSNWTQANARFAVYTWGGSAGEKWIDMTDSDGDGVYEAQIPTGYTSIIFCRMNPSTTANNWNNKWNQTSDLTLEANSNNCYTVKSGTWDKGGGTWSHKE